MLIPQVKRQRVAEGHRLPADRPQRNPDAGPFQPLRQDNLEGEGDDGNPDKLFKDLAGIGLPDLPDGEKVPPEAA